jgi:DNA-binding response OmpR family regulator
VQKLLCILICCYVAIAFPSGRSFRGCGGLRQGQSLIRQSKSTAEKETSSESRDRWILLVEDEGDLRSAIGKFLAKNGYFVTGVSDARSAILVCRGIVRPVSSGSGYRYKFDPNFAHHPKDSENSTNSSATPNNSTQIPDCVVLDIQLVGSMNGLGLLKIIRSDPMLASLPVVLLTAKGKVEDRIVGYEHGADAYLPKPFDPDELVSIVNGLLLRDKMSRPSNTKNIAVYGDLKRELMEVKALLSLDVPPRSSKSEISADSLRRDISEIKDAIKSNVNRSTQSSGGMDRPPPTTAKQVQTLSVLTPGKSTL